MAMPISPKHRHVAELAAGALDTSDQLAVRAALEGGQRIAVVRALREAEGRGSRVAGLAREAFQDDEQFVDARPLAALIARGGK
jgi:hypothetical protein